MEQGSPSKSTSPSSLGQTRQSYYGHLISPEFNSGMPYYWTRPRVREAEEPQSYVALLNGSIQNTDTQQIGPSFSRPPVYLPHGNPDLGTYNMTVETPTPTPFRGMGGQNPRFNAPNYGINPGSNYAEGSSSRSKGKMISQDDIDVPNYPTTWNSFYRGDQRYSSSNNYDNSSAGYSVYDERYQGLGLPVDPHLRLFNLSIYGNGNAGYM